MITIEKKEIITVANWQVESVQMLNMASSERHSIVTYILKDDSGVQLDKIDLVYRDEEYNNWYFSFNEMKFLETELAKHLNITNSSSNIESEYLN